MRRAKEYGVKNLFNPAPAFAELPAEIFSLADIICPNESEAEILSGVKVDSLATAEQAGRIIQNSSVLGFAALRYRGAYNATKFAIEGLTDTMRLELKGSGIDMILIEPGPIRTKIRENAYANFKKWITPDNSVYAALYRDLLIPRLSAQDPHKDPFELGPEAVTKAVIHAAESRRPKLRYRVTWATSLMMIVKRILPTRAMDFVARHF